MSFDVSALSNYTEENKDVLISRTVLTPKTAKIIEAGGTVLVGVKTSEKIGDLQTDAVFQAGGCGFNASGTTKISQRTVTVGDIKIEEQLCYKDLEAKYTQKMLTAGALYENPEDFDFYQMWVDKKIEAAGINLEKAIWMGDKSSVDGQLNKFDGLVKQINAASDVIDANATPHITTPITAATGFTRSNVLSALEAVVVATPQELKASDDYRVFVAPAVLELANLALKDANLYHYKPESPDELVIPGTTVRAIAVPGLTKTAGIFGMRISNMVIGTDLLSDQTTVQVWYEKKDNAICYRNAFKYGVGLGFTAEVVKFVPKEG